MGRDQLFKTILEGLFRDFLELFFPDVAARLDFESLRFLGKEVFANVPEGKVREADAVARLETRGSPQPERSASEASRGASAVGVGPHGIDRRARAYPRSRGSTGGARE